MGQRTFGGGSAEVAMDLAGNATGGVRFTVWDASTGGVQITSLSALDDSQLPGIVTSDDGSGEERDLGRIYFKASDAYSVLYLDRGYGSRWAIMAREIGTLVGTAISRSDEAYDYMQSIQHLIELGSDVYAPAQVRGAIPDRVFDVDYYGAQGDGTTNDTRAVQDAADACRAAGGGRILFTPGSSYLMPAGVTLGSHTHIVGPGATLIKQGASDNYAFFAMISGGPAGYGSGGRGLRITGVTCRGDFANGLATCLAALHHVDDVVIEQVSMLGALIGGHAVDLCGCRHVTVMDSDFAGRLAGSANKEAIQVDKSASSAMSYHDDPASYDELPTVDVTVTRSRFRPYKIGGTLHPAPMAFGSHSLSTVGLYSDLAFTDNTVEGVDADSTPGAYTGAVHFIGAQRVRVAGNTFDAGSSGDVYMIATYSRDGVRCQDFIIEGNNFVGETPASRRPVHILELDGMRFVNNIGRGVGGGTGNTVLFSDTTRLLALGNDISAGPGSVTGTGIMVSNSASTLCLVDNNIVTGFATPIAQGAGQTSVTIGTGNITS